MKMFSRIATALVAMLTLCTAARADWTNGCPGCGPNYNSAGCFTLTNFDCIHSPIDIQIAEGVASGWNVLQECTVNACCDSDGATNQVAYARESGWEITICITGGGKAEVGVPVIGGVEVSLTVQGCFKYGRKTVETATLQCAAGACKRAWNKVLVSSVPVTITVTIQKRTRYTINGCGNPPTTVSVGCGTYTQTGSDSYKRYSFESRDESCNSDCGCGHPCTARPCCR